MGDYDKAMQYLEQALVALSELGDGTGQASTYASMGELLLARGGREKEAIEILQTSSGILETHGPKGLSGLSATLCNLGEAYMRIKAWDDAITTLEKSISISASIEFELSRNGLQSDANQILGRTYLEQYYSGECLVGVPEKEAKSYAKLHSAVRKPSTFGVKMILASLTYILTWHRHTIFSVAWRMLS